MSPSSPSPPAPAPADDCPLCLEPMKSYDVAHPLRCTTAGCGFNFCAGCIQHLIESSRSGYQEASDGSRQVKVKLICPQCRCDLSKTIESTLQKRKTAEVEFFQGISDCELSSSELQRKYANLVDSMSPSASSSSPPGLEATTKSGSGGSLFGDDEEVRKRLSVDTTLFGGLEFAMTEAEQQYVTQLMTSGQVEKLAQAAMILASVSEISRKGITPSMRGGGGAAAPPQPPAAAANPRGRTDSRGRTAVGKNMRSGYSGHAAVGRAVAMSRTDEEKKHDALDRRIEEHRKKYPLPVRMPRQVTLDVKDGVDPDSKKFPLTFLDDEWDGTMADAFSRIYIGRKNTVKKKPPKEHADLQSSSSSTSEGSGGVGVNYYEAFTTAPKARVVVASSKGKAAKVGIQVGDVVTHFNGEIFEGRADNLRQAMRAVCLGGEDDTLTMVLNAEYATAEALRRRSQVV